jgi:hypothetical protein
VVFIVLFVTNRLYYNINTNSNIEAFRNKPNYIWLYWENKPNVMEPPKYIQLCHDTVRKHCGNNFVINILNEKTIHNYLADLRPDIETLNIPQKADYYRLKLLYEYGGIWLDSDIIVMKNLGPIINKLNNKHDFVGFGCHYRNCKNTGHPKPANWVMASKPKTEFMRRCVAECDNILDTNGVTSLNNNTNYFALGRTLLWTQIAYCRKNIPNWDYYHYDSKCLDRDSKYVKIRNKRLMSNEDIDGNCINKSLFIPVYNTAPGFPSNFLNLSKNEILEAQLLISKLFRKSLN